MSALSRRLFLGSGLLAVTGAGVAAGAVTTDPPRRTTSATRTPTLQPVDPPALAAAVRRELDLIGQLTAAATGNPQLAARVDVLLTDHRAHAQALQALLSTRVRGSAAGSATPTAGERARSKDLLAWEKKAAAAAINDCVATGAAALPASAVGLVASIAACEASHVAWLS